MDRHPEFLLVGAMVVLSGCAADPSVRYQAAASFEDVLTTQSKLIDTYYPQRNELTIAFKAVDAAGKPVAEPLVVVNRRTEDTSKRMLLLRGDPLWTRTTVNLLKVENTDLIKSAGVEVADRRAELITNVASIAKVLIPIAFGAASGTTTEACGGVDPSMKTCTWTLPANAGKGAGHQPVGAKMTIAWDPVPVTAAPADDARVKALLSKPSHGMFYPACRSVAIYYVPAGARAAAAKDPAVKALLDADSSLQPAFVWRGKVADPQYLEYVAFPRKGSIEFHTQCGVSVKTEKDPTLSSDALILTSLTQAISVKEAIEKAEEAKKKAEDAETAEKAK